MRHHSVKYRSSLTTAKFLSATLCAGKIYAPISASLRDTMQLFRKTADMSRRYGTAALTDNRQASEALYGYLGMQQTCLRNNVVEKRSRNLMIHHH
jgi:hypothetical protein